MTPAVVFAAGTASRFRGGNKLLAHIDGLPLVVRVVAGVCPAARPVIVVTGYQAARVRRCLRHAFGRTRAIRFVHNPGYRDGMAGSMKLGIKALPRGTLKAFLCLGDMPGVEPRLLRRLQKTWSPGLDFVRPVCRHQCGHPVLMSARLFGAVNELVGDRGAKSILASVPLEGQKRVPWHSGCIIDTDTPAALRHAERMLRRNATRPGCSSGITALR